MAKSKLKAVDPKEAEPSKPKILIFGQPGVGKTWASLDFPGVYYIDTEGGASRGQYTDKLKKSGGVYMGPDQGALDFDTITGQIQALATEAHDYKTLVIDSFTKLYITEIASEYERLVEAGKKIEFSVEKKPATSKSRSLVNWLSRIDMNIILICHEKALWKNGEQIGETFDGYEKLAYELDLCMNIVKAGPNRVARITKTRVEGFVEGTSFPWSYAEFANKYGKDVIEGDVKQLVLVTAQQLQEIKTLLSIVKLPENQEDKWFTAAKVDKWEEMDADKAGKIIDYIKKTYINVEPKGEAA
jgi:hypothetical protein